MYEIPFFFSLLNRVFISLTNVTITVNLMAYELIILSGVNGCAHNIFEVKSLNTALPTSRGCLVCVYPYF